MAKLTKASTLPNRKVQKFGGQGKQFREDVKAFAEAFGIGVGQVIRKTAFDMFGQISDRTAVDTGRARASWNIELNKIDTSVAPEKFEGGESGANKLIAEKRGRFIRKMVFPSDTIYISNNLVYITVLEYGTYVPPNPGPQLETKGPNKGKWREPYVRGGFSIHSPHGMMRITLREWTKYIHAAAEEIRKANPAL